MKIRYILFSLLGILAGSITESSAQSNDTESARTSVVKIKTSYPTGANGKHDIATATGWCWKDPTIVITALHAVAGSDKITVYKNATTKCDAKIEKVLKEADLAMLRLTNDLGLVPLKLQAADPNSSIEYSVWGFPQGVYSIQGDDIRFSRCLEKAPTLNSILTGDKLKNELENQGYPLPVAHIIRISSIIQPGHSGAPIFAKDGTVIGVADGGLRGGAARINWAMPAYYYVPKLVTSMDLIPKTPSLQTSLYSTRTEVDANATEEEENKEYADEVTENKIINGNQSISKTWTASYDDILSTMAKADIEDMNKITQSFNIDMTDTQYDIYEGYETGATITVPAGENFIIQDGWFYSSNADGSLIFDALPFASETFANAKANATLVFQQNFTDAEWGIDINTPDYNEVNDEEEWGIYEFTREARDGSGNTLFYRAEVDGPSLLVTFMIYNQGRLTETSYVKSYLYYSLAMEMATFEQN